MRKNTYTFRVILEIRIENICSKSLEKWTLKKEFIDYYVLYPFCFVMFP